ncbi:MAG TPA: lipid II flippase MurJ, partial [Verrucomicrobiae bacterium]|nr:lipid II flippase MurJ [Verrucomicrobiae bacterium]
MKAAGLMGFMTLISRVIGMIRDVVSAQAFGTTWQWDAFLYAFMIPNFFRRLVGEGALSSVFIPVYNEIYQTQGKEEAFRFSKSLLSILETSCLVIIAVFLIGIQFFLQIKGLPPRALLIADLLRFLLPYMALMSSYALFMGVLNSHKEFLTSSFGPVIMNVGWIAGIILITTYGPRDLVLQLRWQSLVTV